MSFSKTYNQIINQQTLKSDRDQCQAVKTIDILYHSLAETQTQQQGILDKIRHHLSSKHRTPNKKGLYLWGGIGRGKTWLMDLFFESLPFKEKSRYHFNHFMQYVHKELQKLEGQTDPLKLMAKKIAAKTRIICLDEFQVTDIADAMLLHGLLDALFNDNITITFTSNTEPEELYKNGLQRARFLPAIELLNQYTHVVNLSGNTDYRQQKSFKQGTYYTPINGSTDRILLEQFEGISDSHIFHKQVLEIQHRPITAKLCSDNRIWFEFEELCGTYRSTNDYIDIARRYQHIVISNIPILDEYQDDKAYRFIRLIDELYDNKNNLYASAADEPSQLYRGRRLKFDFQRTASRLVEMRSNDYRYSIAP